MEVSPNDPTSSGSAINPNDPVALVHLLVSLQSQSLETQKQVLENQRQHWNWPKRPR